MTGKIPARVPSNVWDVLKWFVICIFIGLFVIIILANATPRCQKCPVCPAPVQNPGPNPGPDSLV